MKGALASSVHDLSRDAADKAEHWLFEVVNCTAGASNLYGQLDSKTAFPDHS